MRLGKILIVDGSNLLHRQLCQPSLWALEYSGKKTGAVFGFFRSLLVILSKYPTHYPIIIFDKGRSARRLALYPNYKRKDEKKKEKDDKLGFMSKLPTGEDYLKELYRQGDIIQVLLSKLKIPTLVMRGWEGDDLMAILSRLVEDGIIITDDRDMYQLLSENTAIYRSTQDEVVRLSDATDPIYLNSRSYVIHKSIVGDVSDNIPQVAKGIGDRRALDLVKCIVKHNEVPEAYLEEMKTMKEGYVAKFIENHDNYLLNKHLIDLSLIDNDPAVLQELITQLVQTNGIPQLIDVITVLSSEGITAFDYQKLISHIVRTRQQVKEN